MNITDVIKDVSSLLSHNKSSEALALLRKAEKKNLYSAELFLLASKAHGLEGDSKMQAAAIDLYLKQNERDVAHYIKAANEIIKDKNYSLAQSILNETIRRFPLSALPYSTQARLCAVQDDFEGAANNLILKQQYGKLDKSDNVAMQLVQKNISDIDPTISGALLNSDQAQALIVSNLLSQCESLGADCEVGFVHRAHGQEPMSLFRWAGMPFQSLISLINSEFKGFASEESSKMTWGLNPNTGNNEYHFLDTHYQFEAHTFFTKKNINIDEDENSLLKKSRSHHLLLARKIMEDLEDAQKIFIFKAMERMDIAQYLDLHRAINTYGKNKLLIVEKKSSTNLHDNENLRIVEPNLLIGKVDCFFLDNGRKNQPHMETWNPLILEASKYFSSQQQEIN